MRRFLMAVVTFGAVGTAQAADMPDFLRGSVPADQTPTRNWDGWYAGGQVGYSAANIDFRKSLQGLTNFIFRDTVLEDPTSQLSALSRANPHTAGFGGFVGRNYQWDDLVFGVEANYSYLNGLAGSSTSSIGPLLFVNPKGETPPPNTTDTYAVTLSGTAAVHIKDVITLRGRTGWATGNFLPYVFGGVAVGRMDVSRSVTSFVTKEQDVTTTNLGVTTTVFGPPVIIPSLTTTVGQERPNNFVVGWTGGLGMEYMLWNNVFMRGEWEYIRFLSVENTSVTMNTVRAGIGYKF
ncbi:MAG: porin family protein [Bradyrhizobium sp.]|uniref:outer membrane protein n=1 Tax=Bradyrhizobium sp. TaxID=376 RepID=UPI0011F4FED9|nr:outer membrane beta-barrel protein [Bradyrhizobium sp.]THD63092.1 MAG: porin family protein [Bradyrhizobium sp.]